VAAEADEGQGHARTARLVRVSSFIEGQSVLAQAAPGRADDNDIIPRTLHVRSNLPSVASDASSNKIEDHASITLDPP